MPWLICGSPSGPSAWGTAFMQGTSRAAQGTRREPCLQHSSAFAMVEGRCGLCEWPVSYTHLRAHETSAHL
eukprot:14363718-Alexandrium_andersonii.AAC.1